MFCDTISSYGPANHEDFARWWGTQSAPAKRLFKSIEGELVHVDLGGYKAWMLTKDEALADLDAGPTNRVRLLPNSDSYVL